jgi:hypothetical protein
MRRASSSRAATTRASLSPVRRVRPDQLSSLVGQARDVGADHTAVEELIRLINLTRVWRHWRKPVVVVVSRDAPAHYACLREIFRGAPWADVVLDRRHRTGTPDGPRPWAIVHADRVDADALPLTSARSGHDMARTVVRLLRWTWNTGWRIGQSAAYQTRPLWRG